MNAVMYLDDVNDNIDLIRKKDIQLINQLAKDSMLTVDKFVDTLEPVRKAWKLNTKPFNEPWYLDERVVISSTKGEAKQIILRELYADGAVLLNGEDPKFTDIVLSRHPAGDIVKCKVGDIESSGSRSCMIEKLSMHVMKRYYAKMAQDNPGAMCYIKKGGYYYRDNCAGYTEYQLNAGVYPIRQAINEVIMSSRGDAMKAILIDKEEHNKYLLSEIEKMKARIIP